jgi:hypothetical protein
MKAAGVTHMVVAFYQIDKNQAVQRAAALKQWMPSSKGELKALVSCGGQGATIPRNNTASFGADFGNYALVNGFDGMDFDIEDDGLMPHLTADIIATFVIAAVGAYKKGSPFKEMPLVSINPGLYDDPAGTTGNKLLTANFGALRKVHDTIEVCCVIYYTLHTIHHTLHTIPSRCVVLSCVPCIESTAVVY